MKKTILILTTLLYLNVSAQLYPDYKVPVPETVSLSHSCMQGNMKQIYQGAGTSDPSTFVYQLVSSDKENNIYYTGFADFTTTTPNPEFPYAVTDITFGSNTQSKLSRTRQTGYYHFIVKYKPNGEPEWVNFFTEEPKKLIVDDEEQLVYVVFNATGNGIGVNGTIIPLDSSYSQSGELVILSFNQSDGNYTNIYKNRYTVDFLKAGNKKILVYSRQYTSTYYDIRYGFFENNQVKNWPYAYLGAPREYTLRYNPHQQAFWSSNGIKYTRILIPPGKDSLIAEGITRKIYLEFIQPFNILSPAEKLYFLPDGGYIGLYLGKWTLGDRKHLVRCDSSGNVIWRVIVSFGRVTESDIAFDKDGDLWINFNTHSYYDKVDFESNSTSYFIDEYGNVGMGYPNALWKIDVEKGTLKNAFYNGYGTLAYENKNLVHITSDNRLITSPGIGSLAYFPDMTGNFISYYASCSTNIVPSQAVWNSYNLNSLQVMTAKVQNLPFEQADFSVYPNPSNGIINLETKVDDELLLFDQTGRLVKTISVFTGQHTYTMDLPDGVYTMKLSRTNAVKKLILLKK